jgi:hypothetical protein
LDIAVIESTTTTKIKQEARKPAAKPAKPAVQLATTKVGRIVKATIPFKYN